MPLDYKVKSHRCSILKCVMGKTSCTWQLVCSGTEFECSALAVGGSKQADVSET